MKLFAVLVTTLLLNCCLYAQKEANIWYFGSQAGMDFNGGAPVPIFDGVLNTIEGCATICDGTTGALLFYTDGINVWNRNHQIMSNGSGLLGDASSTQSAIIVPKPGSDRFYYIFTTPDIVGPGGLVYSEVDMDMNGGLGNITSLKNKSLNPLNPEKVTAACHSNGTDFWVVTHDWNNNHWLSFQVSSAGVDSVPVTSAAGMFLGGIPTNALGQLKMSPDGRKLAHCTWTFNMLEVADFNPSTGVVSNAISLPHSGEEYGTAFSPDGTKLYFTSCCANPNQITQFDLTSGVPATMAASKATIWSGTPSVGKGSMQLGPDGKIYVSMLGGPSLGVINNPNRSGAACNYVDNGFSLTGRTSFIGLPNFVPCFLTVLPFEFASFYASTTEDRQVDLFWAGKNLETNGAHEVQRSRDGAYFYSIGEAEVAHEGNWNFSGTFRDPNPLSGVNYYRIAAYSQNGEHILSEVITVTPDPNELSDFQLTPNPAKDHFHLNLMVLGNQTGSWFLSVYSANGQLIEEKELGELPPGQMIESVKVKDWEAGLYYVQLRCNGYQGIKKIVITH